MHVPHVPARSIATARPVERRTHRMRRADIPDVTIIIHPILVSSTRRPTSRE